MKASFPGKWIITEMEQWDKDYIDLEEEGYIEINKKGDGSFKFGLVEGQIDYVVENIGNEERLQFTWEGMDEMDTVTGRGWITHKDKGPYGKLFFHLSDSSWFKAKKA